MASPPVVLKSIETSNMTTDRSAPSPKAALLKPRQDGVPMYGCSEDRFCLDHVPLPTNQTRARTIPSLTASSGEDDIFIQKLSPRYIQRSRHFADLQNLSKPVVYHPNNDVFVHTMQRNIDRWKSIGPWRSERTSVVYEYTKTQRLNTNSTSCHKWRWLSVLPNVR